MNMEGFGLKQLSQIAAIVSATIALISFVKPSGSLTAAPAPTTVAAPPARGYAGFCGIAPDNLIYCCNDQWRRLYIQYEGYYSPYQYYGVRYTRVCFH